MMQLYEQTGNNQELDLAKSFWPVTDIKNELTCFINYEAKTCSFDSEKFINLLIKYKEIGMLEAEKKQDVAWDGAFNTE